MAIWAIFGQFSAVVTGSVFLGWLASRIEKHVLDVRNCREAKAIQKDLDRMYELYDQLEAERNALRSENEVLRSQSPYRGIGVS
jgi:hypothetical protein